VTQQNSALVEENAATAKTLEHQARAMDEQVAFFQVEAAETEAPAPQSSASKAHRKAVQQAPRAARAA